MVNSNWMKSLPKELRGMSIIYLAIPGSHNSMSYGITAKSTVAPDADTSIRRLYWVFPCFVRRWAKTQSASVEEQLQLGVRYFDLRVCQKDEKFYYAHGLLSLEIFEPLLQILTFLNTNPGEIVILDFQHFYDFMPKHHFFLQDKLKRLFGNKLFTRRDGPLQYCNVDLCEETEKGLIIIYRRCPVNLSDDFWPSITWPTPWPNVDSSKKLKCFLDNSLLSRQELQGYVSQCVLTPTSRYIALRFLSSLRRTAKKVDKNLKDWIILQCPGPFDGKENPKVNVFIADFVNLKDGQFCNWVIELNKKLCSTVESETVIA